MTSTAMLTRAERRQVQRSAAATQRQPVEADSPLAQLQARANAGPHATALASLQASVAQRAANNRTGLPDRLRAGLESLSGRDLSGVRVHYNSPKPAQLAAHAFAQGSDIHLAPGQERHLPHEGWHAVQQMEGRVRPTMQLQGTAINDNAALEREADKMGALAQRQPDRGAAPGARTPEEYQSLVGSRRGAPTQLAIRPALGKAASHLAGVLQQQVLAQPEQRAATAEHLAGNGKGIVQRFIKLKASQHAARVGQDGVMSRKQLREYYQLVMKDDYNFAYEYNPNQNERDTLRFLRKHMMPRGRGPVLAHHITAADQLAHLINGIIAQREPLVLEGYRHPQPIPNKSTRYGVGSYVSPLHARYVHTKLNKAAPDSWSNDDAPAEFWNLLEGAPSSTPRNITGDIPEVRQLKWEQAKKYLPRPLINLLFDVKSQLTANAQVIDERTRAERARKQVTPTGSGTLRSWHEDQPGILPAHQIADGTTLEDAAALDANRRDEVVKTPGDIVAKVPTHSQKLHKHYRMYSGKGHGAAAGTAKAPRGFAEYTGAGGDIHNLKVVVDYVSVHPRVYLTLSHYQYWGIWTPPAGGGTPKFVETKEPRITEATRILNDHVRDNGGAYQLMNPWIEVLVP